MRDPQDDLTRYSIVLTSESDSVPGPPSVVSGKSASSLVEDKYSVAQSPYTIRNMKNNSQNSSESSKNGNYSPFQSSRNQTTTGTSNTNTTIITPRQSQPRNKTNNASTNSSFHTPRNQTWNSHFRQATPFPKTYKNVSFTDSPAGVTTITSVQSLSHNIHKANQVWENEEISALTQTPRGHTNRGGVPDDMKIYHPFTHNHQQDPIMQQPPPPQQQQQSPQIFYPPNSVTYNPQHAHNTHSTSVSLIQPFSIFGACGSSMARVEDIPSTPTPAFACELLQEEVHLLNNNNNRNQSPSIQSESLLATEPSTPNHPTSDQLVHPSLAQQSKIPLSKQTEVQPQTMTVRQTQIESNQDKTNNNLRDPVVDDDGGRPPPPLPPIVESKPIPLVSSTLPKKQPSEDVVREMLKQVQRKARQTAKALSKSNEEKGQATSLPNPNSVSYSNKPKLEPEQVITKNHHLKESRIITKTKNNSAKKAFPEVFVKATNPAKTKEQRTSAPPNTTTSEKSTQVDRHAAPATSKSTMLLTRRKPKVETDILESILPRPKSTTSARKETKSNNVSTDREWEAARRKRFEDLRSRVVVNSVSPPLKLSTSMQVESSSSVGSGFGGFETRSNESNQVTTTSETTTGREDIHNNNPKLFSVARPGSISPSNSKPFNNSIDKGEEQDNHQKPMSSTRIFSQLPPRHDARRSGFWGSPATETKRKKQATYVKRDRIEESRDGRDDDFDREEGITENIREPPDSIYVQNDDEVQSIDPTESTRELPNDHVSSLQYELGIPSLRSQQSSNSNLYVKPRVAKSIHPSVDDNHSANPVYVSEGVELRYHPIRGEKKTSPTVSLKEPTKLNAEVKNGDSPFDRQRLLGSPKLDQKTVRLLYASEFALMVRSHSLRHVEKILSENRIDVAAGRSLGVSFAIWKRPLSQEELQSGDFDVVETPAAHPDALVLYEASILSDRKTRDLKAHLFRFDAVFPDSVSDEAFYLRMGQPYVLNAMGGYHGTFVLVGNQGSGKSHLINKIQERAALDIFAGTSYDMPQVYVRCFELHGDQCVDLLGPIGSFVRVVKEKGSYEVNGAVASKVSNPDGLLSILDQANRRFTTQKIVRKRSASWSYFVCEIRIENVDGTIGHLSFVECPHEDQHRMTHAGGTVSNEATPYACLMKAIAAKVSSIPVDPTCNLTKILDRAVQSKHSETCVIGTVSAGSSDTEGTLSTLLCIKQIMKGLVVDKRDDWTSQRQEKAINQKIASPEQNMIAMPRGWSKETLLSWMDQKKLISPKLAEVLANESEEQLSGHSVMRMTKLQLQHSFYEGLEDGEKRAEKLFIALRAENDRVGRQRLKQRRARENNGNE